MTRFDGLKAEHYARKYINKIKNYSSKATYITDKMPNNFLRIGLIKLLLPNARIIHCERHALDTCLSIYSNYFTGGNLYSFDLREIGEYYLDYQKLMHHWFDIFQTEILNVQYEALVENQEQESRRILEYLGLEWNEQCLTFHENKRAVATTSQLQVRQPMYKNSVNKWKYYEEYLGPLLATIQL